MSSFNESRVVDYLASCFRAPQQQVPVGIGDDCAIVALGSHGVLSVDTAVEGVHFDLALMSLEDVAYRAFQAALSDLAAMGARPVGALCSWILPRGISELQIRELAQGTAQAAREQACAVVGGNLSRGGELSLTTTVVGTPSTAARPLRRNARAGHEVWLCGTVGEAALGLRALRSAARSLPERACVQRFLRPVARVEDGQALASVGAAMLDVSDGLAEDACKLARASGVRLVLCERLLRRALSAELLGAARVQRTSALRAALYGGEDYALLATGEARSRPPMAQRIGWVERGVGVALQGERGRVLLRRGFDHLSGA